MTRRAPRKPQRQHGFTLLEAIVTLVIFSMLVAMLMQALQQSLAVRERIQKHQEASRVDELPSRWFRDSIGSAIATIADEGLGMTGTPQAIKLTTQAPLEGRWMENVSWTLKRVPDGDELVYDSPEWKDLVAVRGPLKSASFAYMDEGGQWQSQWSPADKDRVRLPRAVRLQAQGPNGPLLWIVAVMAERRPTTRKLPQPDEI